MATTSKSGTTLANILFIVAVIGALNWGLVGFFNWNLVNAIFGGETASNASALSRILYALVGLCGLGALFFIPRMRFISPQKGAVTARRRREVTP